MNPFQNFQDALEEMYASLTVFSDLNWDAVTQEYIASHDAPPTDLEEFLFNFPQYLQDKALEGDSPAYLFELAFFELIQDQVLNTGFEAPTAIGLQLNPTLSFLNLEYDINAMMEEATKGNVEILHRPHILCMYQHPENGLHHLEITPEVLEILQQLENGLPPKTSDLLGNLMEIGAVLDIR